MPDLELFKVLVQFGALGVLSWVLWRGNNRFMDAHAAQVALTHSEMSKRISALESANKECQAHRMALQQQIVDLLGGKQEVD